MCQGPVGLLYKVNLPVKDNVKVKLHIQSVTPFAVFGTCVVLLPLLKSHALRPWILLANL